MKIEISNDIYKMCFFGTTGFVATCVLIARVFFFLIYYIRTGLPEISIEIFFSNLSGI